jgi:hypothetical protein
MPFHLYKAWNEGQEGAWFGVHVQYIEDHWVSTCHETDEHGGNVAGGWRFALKFHGVSPEEVHRRMVGALEDMYDNVSPVVHGSTD